MTWGILALLLTGIGAVASWWLFTRRGPLAGATALGWTLLVPAAWLTGLLELGTRVTTAVSRWVSQLVFSPSFWVGVALGGVGILTLLVTGVLRKRGLGDPALAPTRRTVTEEPEITSHGQSRTRTRGPSRRSAAEPTAAPDDEFGDIEAMLRQRGIE